MDAPADLAYNTIAVARRFGRVAGSGTLQSATCTMTDPHPGEPSVTPAAPPPPARRPHWPTLAALAAILLAAAYFATLSLFSWDEPSFRLHPDERFMTDVASRLLIPAGLGDYFDSAVNPLNPRNREKEFYVYGLLPQTLTRLTAVMLTPNEALPPTVVYGRLTGDPAAPQTPNPERAVPKLTVLQPLLNPRGVNLTDFYEIHKVGRAWSVAFFLGSVLVTFLIGRRLYGRRVGLLAALLLALAVLPIQLAHFFTVDSATAFFTLLSVYWAVRVSQGGGPLSFAALGLSIGAAMACRVTMAALGLLAVLAVAQRLFATDSGQRAADDGRLEAQAPTSEDGASGHGGRPVHSAVPHWLVIRSPWSTVGWLVVAGALAFFTFRVLQPDAFVGSRPGSPPVGSSVLPSLDPLFAGRGLFDLRPDPRFIDNIRSVSEQVSGEQDAPPSQQWAGRTRYLFAWQNMVLWGLGPLLGLAGWLGWAVAGWRMFARRAWRHLLPWAWIAFYFAWQGGQFGMTMRYYLNLYGLLALFAAWGLGARRTAAGEREQARLEVGVFGVATASLRSSAEGAPWPAIVRRWPSAIGRWSGPVVVLGTLLWAIAFTRIYTHPHSRIEASRWIYDNIPPGATLTFEEWDDPLPLGLDGRSASQYTVLQTKPYWEDAPEKYFAQQDPSGQIVPGLLDQLDQADYVILSSNRVYDSTRRLPMRYPALARYYHTLFDGSLGFELAADIHSFPNLFGIEIPTPILAEEAFSVYDHPRVLIFKKTPAYTRANAERLITGDVTWDEVYKLSSLRGGRVPTALRLTADQWPTYRAAGSWIETFATGGLNAAAPWLPWLLAVELLGLAAFPLLFRVTRLPDGGYALAKTLGLLGVAWAAWMLASLGALPFSAASVWLCTGLLLVAGALAAWPRRAALWAFVRRRRAALLTAEGLFLLAFFAFLLVRSLNPDLWHPARGGEKPMDLAFLTAVARSPSFPPYDPWFAGGYINYYYFGYVLIAALMRLTGIVPTVAYNLAVPTVFALTALGAWGAAYNLFAPRAARWRLAPPAPRELAPMDSADSPVPADPRPQGRAWPRRERRAISVGLAAAVFVALLGPLTQALWFLPGSAAPPDPTLPAACRSISSYAAQQVCRGRPEWAFWDATRSVSIALAWRGESESIINEFPFFTFLFGDLHAHMLALPLVLAALGLMGALVRSAEGSVPRVALTSPGVGSRRSVWHGAWCILNLALVVGALRATNTWDYPGVLGLSVLTLGLVAWDHWRHGLPWPWAAAWGLGAAGLLWLLSTLLFLPFTRAFATDYAGFEPWRGVRTPAAEFLKINGLWLFLLIAGVLADYRARGVRPGRLLAAGAGAAGLAAVAVVAPLSALALLVPLFCAGLGLVADMLLRGRADRPGEPGASPATVLAALWGLAAVGLSLASELIVAKGDIGRMNTVFKLGMQSWVLYAIAAALAGARVGCWLGARRRTAGDGVSLPLWTFRAAAGLLIAAALVYPLTATGPRLADRFDPQIGPTLDGAAYMRAGGWAENGRGFSLAGDADALAWMRRTIDGTPIVLEAHTEAYRWGGRVATYTGFPTLLGWPWHETQQRSVADVGPVLQSRQRLIQQLYSGPDGPAALETLRRYGVEYVYVGELERALYDPAGLAKFDALAQQGALEKVYDRGGVAVYRVPAPAAVPAVVQNVPPVAAPRPVPEPRLLLDRPVGELPAVNEFAWNRLADSQPVAVLLWLLAWYALLLLGLPLAALVFWRWRDAGFTWARLVGLLVLGYAVWLPVSLRLWSYTRIGLLLGVVLVLGLDMLALARIGRRATAEGWVVGASPLGCGWRALLARLRARRRWIAVVEALFLAGFGCFLAIRMLNPDLWHPIWGGEKPFEFGILNAILRSPVMPPYTPFFSDGVLNYYYYGFFLVSLPIKATGIAPAVAFNLTIPTLVGLTVAGAFAIVGQLTRRGWAALAGAALLAVAGSLSAVITTPGGQSRGLAPVRDALAGGLAGFGERLGDWYFYPSRVIPYTINEFPFWSFLFADLHPHVIALPVTLLAIGLALALFEDGRRLPSFLLAALTLGALAVTNSWDFPTYALLLTGALLGAAWRAPRPALLAPGAAWGVAADCLAALLTGAAIAGIGLLLYLPFFQEFVAQVRGIGLVRDPSPLYGYLVIYGLFLAILVPSLLGAAWRLLAPTDPGAAGLGIAALPRGRADRASLRMVLIVVPAALLMFAVAAPAAGLRLWLLALLAAGLGVLASRRIAAATWFALWLAVVAWAVSLGVELVYVRDHLAGGDSYRMNTVFKFGFQVWVLLALAAGAALPRLARALRRAGPAAELVGWAPIAALCGLTLVFPLIGTPSRIANRFPAAPGPTLDGLAFLDTAAYDYWKNDSERFPIALKDDAAAIRWLNQHVEGTPVVVQSPLGFYREYGTRIAANTGLPTVSSWLHEAEQRDPAAVGARDADVEALYRTTDAAEALRLLSKYRAGYVIVGPIERAAYGPDGIAKFDALAGYLDPVFRSGAVTIYRVNDSVRSLAPLPPLEGRPASQPVLRPATPAPPAPAPAPADRPAPSLAELERQAAADPTAPGPAFALAQAYRDAGRPGDAANALAPAVAAHPTDVGLLHLWGDALRDAGREDAAVAAWRQAAAAQPTAGNYNKLGLELLRMNRLDTAKEAFTAALAVDANLPEPHYHLGVIAERQGDRAGALAAYRQYLALAPPDAPLRAAAQAAIARLE
jgi:YYY domain-containing protein